MPKKKLNFHHDFFDDETAKFDAVGLAHLLERKEISSNQLIELTLKRAKKVNKKINAICFEPNNTYQKVKAGAHSTFNGIPTYIKDNINLQGWPTNFGSGALPPTNAKKNGSYTEQLLSTGLVILGKSAMPEFGLNATTEPADNAPTLNPWNYNYSAGASSGGAAALVASGVVPIAHGNDGGGSIRIPAACCGLVGLKPSRGRHVNEKLVKALPINIVSEGILSRSIRDTAYYHFELERFYQNKSLPRLPLIKTPLNQRLKIGYFLDSVTGYTTDSETKNATTNSLKLLEELGHHIEEIKVPIDPSFAENFALYWGFLAFTLSKTGKYGISKQFNPDRLDNLTKGLSRHFQKNLLRTPFIIKQLNKEGAAFRDVFNQYDIVVSPVLAQTTRKLGELSPNIPFEILLERLSRYASFTPIANIAGTPAMSLPLGETKTGLPIGVQFFAGFGNEALLIELGYQIEAAAPWQHRYQ